MDREKESPPERLPFCLDDTVGEIVRASQECPGVYYIAARKQDGKFLADEYYVVEKSSPAISKEAMAYGRMPEEDSRVLLYSFAEERRGYKIIEYEIYRYQVRHGIYADGQTSLRDIAFYNMAKLYSFENYTSIVEFLMFRAERAYYLLRKKQRGPHYTWELYIVELLHSQREFVDPLSRAFRNALAQLNFLPAWQVIYPTIQEATEIE